MLFCLNRIQLLAYPIYPQFLFFSPHQLCPAILFQAIQVHVDSFVVILISYSSSLSFFSGSYPQVQVSGHSSDMHTCRRPQIGHLYVDDSWSLICFPFLCSPCWVDNTSRHRTSGTLRWFRHVLLFRTRKPNKARQRTLRAAALWRSAYMILFG